MSGQTIILVCFLLSLVLGVFVNRRLNTERGDKVGNGCVYMGVVYLVVLGITVLGVGGTFAVGMKLVDKADIIYNGDKYMATVVDYEVSESYDSDKGTSTTMYAPIVKFVTNTGLEVVYTFDSSSSSQTGIGSLYEVYYYDETGGVTTFSLGSLAMLLGGGLLLLVGLMLFFGLVNYAMGGNKDRVYKIAGFIGFIIAIPFALILLDMAAVYKYYADLDITANERKGVLRWIVFVTAILIGYIFLLIKGRRWGKKFAKEQEAIDIYSERNNR
ncbi:DUF3592 domain-containing protein [Myroides sp. N17-2]|uniref:DUF3592 domain-containing protein n=1 Tax=Myroides sp. N17-2 TaxID=2030799 RepID=UPI0011804F2D|nr:DUF3592 domain-containing protein [Myroides sp. N17-2]